MYLKLKQKHENECKSASFLLMIRRPCYTISPRIDDDRSLLAELNPPTDAWSRELVVIQQLLPPQPWSINRKEDAPAWPFILKQ